MGTTSDRSTAQSTREATQVAQQEAQRVANAVRERGVTLAAERKNSFADQITAVASVLHDSAAQLSEQNQGQVARAADVLSERLNQWADTVRHNDIDQLYQSAKDLARRQPAVFLTGAVATGFLLSRFLKSSSSS